MGHSRKAASHGRWRTKLVIVPLVCLGLAAAGPAQADSPTVQGTHCSGGKAQPALPSSSLEAPQVGRPAGIQGGRKV
jgi:hypothetical protein